MMSSQFSPSADILPHSLYNVLLHSFPTQIGPSHSLRSSKALPDILTLPPPPHPTATIAAAYNEIKSSLLVAGNSNHPLLMLVS